MPVISFAGANSLCRCRAIPHAPAVTALTSSRRSLLLRGIRARFPHVGVLRWEDLTAARHDMHEGSYCAFQELQHAKAAPPTARCCECVHVRKRSGPRISARLSPCPATWF